MTEPGRRSGRASRALALCAALSTWIAATPLASAQDDARADELIALVERRPSGMDRDAWRERRRDAARELGELGDPRAVPALIEVVETEKFDAVAEIAIEALGKLGDDRAVPVLEAVVADNSRDRYVRQKARAALRALGAEPAEDAAAGEPDGDPDDGDSTDVAAAAPLAPGSLLGREPAAVRAGPSFSPDTLAAFDRLTMAVGGVRLQYDTVRDRPSLDGDVSAHFERVRERERVGYRLDGRGSVAAGGIDFDGADSSSRTLTAAAGAVAEARFYAEGAAFFGLTGASAKLSFDHLEINRPGPDNDTSDTFAAVDLGVTLGAGYGRVLEVGDALRLQRIEAVLRENQALGRPITPDLAERIFRAWWALRSEIGHHERLLATVTILREAGVLVGEPGASLSYQILEILRDGALARRPQGWIAWLAFGEVLSARDDDLGLDEGRAESLLASARYGAQSDDGEDELVGEGFARYRVLAEEGDASPWAVGAAATWRRYHYGERADPLGALEIGADLGLGDAGFDDSSTALRVGGQIGWLLLPSRASRYRIAATARYETGELFVGGLFEVAHGFLDSSFVGAAPYATL